MPGCPRAGLIIAWENILLFLQRLFSLTIYNIQFAYNNSLKSHIPKTKNTANANPRTTTTKNMASSSKQCIFLSKEKKQQSKVMLNIRSKCIKSNTGMLCVEQIRRRCKQTNKVKRYQG